MTRKVVLHKQVLDYFEDQPRRVQLKILAQIKHLQETGPETGRPLVDGVRGSIMKNLKELRIGGPEVIRALFVFDYSGDILFLYAGSKKGQGNQWYEKAIRAAETNVLDL